MKPCLRGGIVSIMRNHLTRDECHEDPRNVTATLKRFDCTLCHYTVTNVAGKRILMLNVDNKYV